MTYDYWGLEMIPVVTRIYDKVLKNKLKKEIEEKN